MVFGYQFARENQIGVAVVNFFYGASPFDELTHEILGFASERKADKKKCQNKRFHMFNLVFQICMALPLLQKERIWAANSACRRRACR